MNYDLTKRERAVLTLKASGRTCPEIGEEIHVSTGSVHSTLFQTYRKIGANNDVHAVAICLVLELIDKDEIEIPRHMQPLPETA